MTDTEKTPEALVRQAILKACEDNNTEDPTQEQIFHANLALSDLAPNDERWNMLNASLFYNLR